MTETAEQAAIGSGVWTPREEAARAVPMGFFHLASGIEGLKPTAPSEVSTDIR